MWISWLAVDLQIDARSAEAFHEAGVRLTGQADAPERITEGDGRQAVGPCGPAVSRRAARPVRIHAMVSCWSAPMTLLRTAVRNLSTEIPEEAQKVRILVAQLRAERVDLGIALTLNEPDGAVGDGVADPVHQLPDLVDGLVVE